MKDSTAGTVDIKKNIIYLNPMSKKMGFGCSIDGAVFEPGINIKLSFYESFFATLIHEIGHFKIKRKVPEYMVRIKEKLEKEYPKEVDMRVYSASDYLKRRKNETTDEYTSRLWELESVICGGNMREHQAVEEWSIKEFKKQRTYINTLSKKE